MNAMILLFQNRNLLASCHEICVFEYELYMSYFHRKSIIHVQVFEALLDHMFYSTL